MFVTLVAALVAAMAAQGATPDRIRAEDLARAGRTADAIELFERVLERDPSDVEARLWLGRLELRAGRVDEAETTFQAVIGEHPKDVDARIGLGSVLTRKGEWRGALEVLEHALVDAGENADLFAALARAYRRGGDDGRALEYYGRAKRLSPSDPDIAAGYESTARAYGHWLAFDGFGEHGTDGANAGSGTLAGSVRVATNLHLRATARAQQRSGASDALFGGGVLWRAGRTLTIEARGAGGADNVSLPTSDASLAFIDYAGAFELGASVRRMAFAGATVVATSPTVSFDRGDRWRVDARYTYSRSAFASTAESAGDHSVMLRNTWRGWRRVGVVVTYAYGIESFEELTAERIGSLGATTAAAGLRIDCPSLSTINTTWEHQWRSNDTTIDRLVVSLAQTFP